MSMEASSDDVPTTSQRIETVPRVSQVKSRRKSQKRIQRNIIWLLHLVPDEKAAAQFLRDKGLLHSERLCPSCGHAMCLGRGGLAWRCHRRTCRKELSVRTGTWFDIPRERIKLQKAVQVLYHWSRGYTKMKFCEVELGLCNSTAVRWCRYLRQLTADALAEAPVQLGGPGMTVELDESLFSRSKYNRGRRYPGQWLFAGVCRDTGLAHVETVENRSSDALLPVIESHVRPASAVMTDEWRAYRCLGLMGYQQSRVNHSQNFVDPDTGAHTQTVESLWAQLKSGNKHRSGTQRSALPLHISEFMWRKRLGAADAFDGILDVICRLHPPKVDNLPAPLALPQ